jgi:ethanolamine permease
MRGPAEFVFYLAVGAGMALGMSAFTVVGGLFEAAPLAIILVAILIGGLICTAVALSIGELASLWPSSPAIRTYFKMAFSERTALTLIYLYLAFIVAIAGVESTMFALVMSALMPALPPVAAVLILLGAVIAANCWGLDLPRLMQVLTTVICIAIILAMGVYGWAASGTAGLDAALAAPQPGAAPGALQGFKTLPAAIGLAIYLFIGFEWITPVGLSPEAYRRRIPAAMLGAILILAFTYAIFALGIALALPPERIAGQPTPQVGYFVALLGPAGLWLAALLSLTAIFSTFNAGLMGGARLLQALAREGTLPRQVAAINPATGAPVGAVLWLGGSALLSSLLVLAFSLQLIAALVGAAIIAVIYAAYMLSVLRLRQRQPETPRPFRTPLPVPLQRGLAALLPLLGLATLFSLPGEGFVPALAFLACAAASFLLAGWSSRHLAAGAGAAARRRPLQPSLAAKPGADG